MTKGNKVFVEKFLSTDSGYFDAPYAEMNLNFGSIAQNFENFGSENGILSS